MGSGNIKGITIQFRGETTQFDEAVRKMNSEIRTTDTELKKVNNALKFNPKNVELWKQKQELLTQKINQTTEKLNVLKDTQKKVDSGEIEMTADEYRNLRREIITTDSKLQNFKKQLQEIGNANLKALSEQLKQIGTKMTDVGKAMTTKVTAPIVAGYTVAAKYASDYEENLNKLDVAFGSNSQTVKDWANTARVNFGLSKVQATDAASAFGALGKGIGLSEASAADMSTTLAGLSADLGSYFNVGVDESAKALEGIFTGESEALKKFGVVMTDTNLQQFAEDQGLVWKEMDQTQKTMLRYQYVLAKTKDAQGDFSRTSDGTANSTKIFQASVQDLGTSIGTVLLPIITPIIQKITEWINKFNELSPRTQKIITIVGLVAAALGPLLVILGTLITSIGAIAGSIGLLAGPIGIAMIAIAALIALGVDLYKNWDTIKQRVKQLKDNLVKTWNNIRNTVTRTVTNLKNSVVNLWNNIKNSVVSRVQSLYNNVVAKWNSIKSRTSAIFNSIKATLLGIWNSIKTSVVARVQSIVSNLSAKWNSIKATASAAWNRIKSAILNPIQTAKDKIKGIIDKIKSYFPFKIGKVMSGLKLPHFKLSGSFSLTKMTVPHLSVDWYKTGGIFDSPSVIGVGEAGSEAVVPLDKFWTAIENSNARTDALLAKQNTILMAVLQELAKEKNFKVDGVWAGRYINSMVR